MANGSRPCSSNFLRYIPDNNQSVESGDCRYSVRAATRRLELGSCAHVHGRRTVGRLLVNRRAANQTPRIIALPTTSPHSGV